VPIPRAFLLERVKELGNGGNPANPGLPAKRPSKQVVVMLLSLALVLVFKGTVCVLAVCNLVLLLVLELV